MIEIIYKNKGQIVKTSDKEILQRLGLDDVLWIDLNAPVGEEKEAAEEFLDTTLQSRDQAEEIESSSRYSETENTINANTNFLIPGPETYSTEPVSFIICEGILVTIRQAPLRSISDIQRRLMNNYRLYHTGYHIMIGILENRIDMDADMIEILAKDITQISKKVDIGERIGQEILLEVNQLQENTMVLRENGIDKQRVISSILKSDKFPRDVFTKMEVMNKDVESLINHSNFSFERLEYLQNTVMGLINLEQNRLMRVFTFVSLLLMPPTLVASIYGMNVKLPTVGKADSLWSFWMILGVMIFSVVIAIVIFAKHKMLSENRK